MKFLTRTIWLLSLTSLFTDIASEMLYPVMPMFLQSIGFSIVAIGVLEGFAEAVASLSKGYFGRVSDARGRRLPLVRLGYTLSAVSKPMMALLASVPGVFVARTTDRLGKGLRTAARDALLSAESRPETKGRVFGFHRGMDPLAALFFLHFHPERYRTLFLVAFIPGVLAVMFTLLMRERHFAPKVSDAGLLAFLRYWPRSPASYRARVAPLAVFAIINSSDIFLLLMMKHRGLSDQRVIGTYIFYNLVYALMSYPIGSLADRIGLSKTLVFGLVLFAGVYAGMSQAASLPAFAALFFLYGLYAAATEGVSKALISNLVPPHETASAIGLFTSLQGIAALLASTLAGLVWRWIAPEAVFLFSAAGALVVAAWLAPKKFQ
jgi:MFS family permease